MSEIPEFPIQCLSNLTRESSVLKGFRCELYPRKKIVPIQQSSDLWIETWLSTGRFGTYLSAARGSRPLALALYEWNAHEKTIWVPYLHTAYPFKTDRRKIHQTLYELREFRNRVAHHEPLLVGSEFERRKIIPSLHDCCPRLRLTT